MDKKLSNFLEQREHTVLTDIDVITAAVAVPFFYLGKLFGAKLIYVEVFDRIDKPTMWGRSHSLYCAQQ